MHSLTRWIVGLLITLVLFGCNAPQERKGANSAAPKVVAAKGYIVPKDSMAEPKAVAIDESELEKIPAEKSAAVPANTHIYPAGEPHVVPAGTAQVCTPGKDSFLVPKIVPAVGSTMMAGIPQVVAAKDPVSKDQNPQNFSITGKLQGLKDAGIRCLLQDRSGNLWFGTAGGASKYDGKSLTHFTKKEGLSDNEVYSVLEDKSGNIWFCTFGGLCKYDGKTFTRFNEKEASGNKVAHSICQDRNGNLWLGTWGGGALKYDGKAFTHFTEKEGLVDNAVNSIIEDKSGNLWFGTDGGISKFDGTTFKNLAEDEGLIVSAVSYLLEDKSGNIWCCTGSMVTRYNGKTFSSFSKAEGLCSNNILTAFEDRNGNLWFGTDGGVSKYDGKSFTNLTEREGLINNVVNSILEDKSGNLWLGTDGGLAKYNGNTFTQFTEKEGLGKSVVWSIFSDKGGNIWLGTAGGVTKFDGKFFSNFFRKDWFAGNVVHSIMEDKKGNLWFGTDAGVRKFDGQNFVNFDKKAGLCNNFLTGMTEDKAGNIWFGTYAGVSKYNGKSFTNFSKKEGLSSDHVKSILEDKNGNLWFATNGGGVCKYNGNTFTHFTEKEGFINNFVSSILEDKNGNLWFGTDAGIAEYDGSNFIQFTEKEGLSNNGVSSILEDNDGNLWFGTQFGLSKLSYDKLAGISEKIKSGTLNEGEVLFKNYTYEDGFLGIGCNDNAICKAKDGTIWIGADDRLAVYHPEGDLADTIAPNIQLTNIALYNENIAWQNLLTGTTAKDTGITLGNGVSLAGFQFDSVSKWYGLPSHLSLAYNNNYLTFNFIGITQKSPNKVRYKYKLDGIDGNWSALSSRTEAPYGNLPEGTYTFKVKAMNSEGYWSNEFHYTFTIRPPWWKTWWFRAMVLAGIISVILLYIKWRERALKQRQKVLEQTVTERTAEVVAEKMEVEKQKERSEELLLNILPAEVAEELKDKGTAGAKLFNEVTVLYTDFVSFTTISEKLTPQQLVNELHTCFSAFDEIMGKHNIEKIKTVGDAYMAVAGLPLPSASHAQDVVKAAIEIRDFMLNRRKEPGTSTFEIRIGVHSGPVVAGIVGIKKYAYDIWGDTVNTSARMEQKSEAGKINISQTTYDLLKGKFDCEYRGEIEAKNKGHLKMYFVNK